MDEELLARLTSVYRDLHRHPELSSQEHRTAGASRPGCATWASRCSKVSARAWSASCATGRGRPSRCAPTWTPCRSPRRPACRTRARSPASCAPAVTTCTSPACSVPPRRWMPCATAGAERSRAGLRGDRLAQGHPPRQRRPRLAARRRRRPPRRGSLSPRRHRPRGTATPSHGAPVAPQPQESTQPTTWPESDTHPTRNQESDTLRRNLQLRLRGPESRPGTIQP